ncbi:MAG TPA: restriction endonuclease [Thiobacillaceae bacterium]|nr:restriction endonuclease [Thiobacillaceae bacterium]
MTAEKNLWGIHAGRTGDANSLFLKKNRIAIGWEEMGSLSDLPTDWDKLKARVAQVYPQAKPRAIPNYAGQLWRFVHDMKPGDWVVYPSKPERMVYLGEIVGGYQYDPKTDAGYPNVRPVKWRKSLPRTQFSQGALSEIGSAMSLFQVKNYADEFCAVLEGKAMPVTPVTKDETVAVVAQEIEETTRDFILKRLAQELKGLPLEGFVVHLLECMGYHARLTLKNEPSVDVIAHKDHLGIEPPIIKVQVKSSEGTATDKDVSALSGKLSAGEYGLFITLGKFSPASRAFEQGKANLRLIDGDEFVDLIFQHYEHFDARHKGLLPLRRVYVPEDISGGEG